MRPIVEAPKLAPASGALPIPASPADAAAILAEDRKRLLRAREEAEALGPAAVDRMLDEELKRLHEGLRAPPDASANAIVVRVLGTPASKGPNLPLPGLTVRLTLRGKKAAEEKTDKAGIAYLEHSAPAKPGARKKRTNPRAVAVIEVLLGDDEAVATHRITGAEFETGQLIEIPEAQSLGSVFARGAAWSRAEKAAAARAKKLRPLLVKAMKSHAKEIESQLKDLAVALAAVTGK